MPRNQGDRNSSTGRASGADHAASEKTARKSYVPPALQSYGRLVDVTRFGGSQILDSGMGNLRNP